MTPAVAGVSVENSGATRRGETVVLPGQTPDGAHVLAVLLKRSYDIVEGRGCVRRASDARPLAGDVYWDDPMNSTVRVENDFVPIKLATDVVVNGTVHAPGGVPTTSCVASVAVGDVRKEVLVVGDRRALFVDGRAPTFTDPKPFDTMPLRYERAYGGIDVYSDRSTSYPYPRNPLGCGFVVANARDAVGRAALPNLEDPHDRLTPERFCVGDYARWVDQPAPAGFGWVPRTSYPRAQRAGIMPADRAMEQELRQAYAQLVPADQRDDYVRHGLPDMDFAYFNGASAGLVMPFLAGDEAITTTRLTAEGELAFRLPGDAPRIAIDVGFGTQEADVVLHTVAIDTDRRRVELVWRQAVPYPGPDWFPQMKKMDVHVA